MLHALIQNTSATSITASKVPAIAVTTTTNIQNGVSAANKYPTQNVRGMIPACSRINSFRRSLRSASTPAGTLSKKVGTIRQALIKPRYNAEPVYSRTAQFNATRVIHSPVWPTRFPAAKIPKIRDRSAKRGGEGPTSARALGFRLIYGTRPADKRSDLPLPNFVPLSLLVPSCSGRLPRRRNRGTPQQAHGGGRLRVHCNRRNS